MKNQQKVFIPLIILIVAILAIGGGAFVYKNNKTEAPTPITIKTPSNQNTSTSPTDPAETRSSIPAQNTQVITKFLITYPDGGENIKIGDKVNITWKNSSVSSKKNITIYLIKNLSGCFNLKPGQVCLTVVDPETILASSISNTGNYSWAPTNKGSYYLKVCMGSEKTTSSCDTTDGLFTVIDPVEIADKAPIISNVTGPTNLKVSENGTWAISATDPEGQRISYSMSVTKTYPNQTTPSKIVGIKPVEPYSSVINWKFDQVGTYLLEFTASDFYGKTTTSNMTITVQ